ncbi:MAG: hypothetical protein KF767_12460 [Bdellovibrionaceae bacterium]|nr:hypothetical protein [Pseudobdellovibrionaceae bacterium]
MDFTFRPKLGQLRNGMLLTAALLGSAQVYAQSENALIDKFTMVYLRLAPTDQAKNGVTLRLADLHAERARKLSVEDLAAGEKDRALALKYYREAVKGTPEETQARIWIQMGHLHEMSSDSSGALKAYEQVLALPSTPEQKADAHLSMAEVFFKQRNFPAAAKNYGEVINNEKSPSRGFAAYRMAWVDFNTGRIEPGIQALVKILRTPELSRRSATAGAGADQQFQEEVSRDLATFMAKRRVQKDDLNTLFEVSPASTKVANLMYLAGEAERLGQTNEALQLWQFVHSKQSEPRERLESLIHIAGLQIAGGGGDQALTSYENALQLWQTLGGCVDEGCKELRTRVKNTLVDWNRVEKKNPSEQLVKAYQAFTQTFPEDTAMRMYLAQVARERKDYNLALNTYMAVGRSGVEESEPALIAAIETAELAVAADPKPAATAEKAAPTETQPSANALRLKTAYETYIQHSKKKERLTEVRYQLAKWNYDNGDLETGATQLREFALDHNVKDQKLRDQAANLSLDALAILKDDVRIRGWAEEFASAMPSHAGEKRQVARKALLNQSAKLSEQKDLAAAWALLEKENFANAPAEDRVLLLKNKLVLAEKLGHYPQARLISDELLAQPNLNAEDQQYALSRKAWLSELVLDFDGALTATQKMKANDLPPDQRLLKLAMYADLASKDARSFYTQYLKVSKDSASRVAIASQLVKSSGTPLKEIEVQRAVLAENPEVLGQLYLELFGQTRDAGILKKALATPAVVKSKSGALLQRQDFLARYEVLKKNIAAQSIDASNMKKMAAGLKARVATLNEGDKLANQVIAAGDWTSQVAVFTLLANENERFYQEIMGLPLPQGLSPEEENEYMQALSQQSAPHQTKANDLKAKLAEFWGQADAIPQLEKSLDLAAAEVRPLIKSEIELLSGLAPEDKKAQLAAVANKPTAIVAEKPSVQVLEGAKAAVRADPMNRQSLNNLLELEQKWGRPAMVSYLKGRIESLSSGLGDGKSETSSKN